MELRNNLVELNRVLRATLYQNHVHRDFLVDLVAVLSRLDLYRVLSDDFLNYFNKFLSSSKDTDDVGDNRDNFYELVTAYYCNLIIEGIEDIELKRLSKSLLTIKETLPLNELIVDKLGPTTMVWSNPDRIDLYSLIIVLLKLQLEVINEYITSQPQ